MMGLGEPPRWCCRHCIIFIFLGLEKLLRSGHILGPLSGILGRSFVNLTSLGARIYVLEIVTGAAPSAGNYPRNLLDEFIRVRAIVIVVLGLTIIAFIGIVRVVRVVTGAGALFFLFGGRFCNHFNRLAA
ncbi:hypothetical protein B0H14DRAFT_2856808 [Mycena olivaceomarginata]|nr:hypothetical protein B0H14DRAFT_2856808 [Mycena olivaceomarginata]